MEVRTPFAPSTLPGTRWADIQGAMPQGMPARPDTDEPPRDPARLAPAAIVDVGTRERDRAVGRYVRDADSKSVVFQVFDPTYGEVLAQMPTVSALRNRAYEAVARAMRSERERHEQSRQA